MPNDFETQIDKIVINTEKRLLAVLRQSLDAVIKESQIPVAKGGKMRVDTGFLRNSGISSLNSLPFGPSRGRKRNAGEEGVLPEYDYNAAPVGVTLSKMQIGDIFYFGWTARYARYREARDGFLESALMNWKSHVDKAVMYFKNKDAGE